MRKYRDTRDVLLIGLWYNGIVAAIVCLFWLFSGTRKGFIDYYMTIGGFSRNGHYGVLWVQMLVVTAFWLIALIRIYLKERNK